MTAEKYFNKKDEPDFLVENPKSDEDINKEFLTQLCYDGQMNDDEIDEFVEAIINWKNKQAEAYHKAKVEAITDDEIEKRLIDWCKTQYNQGDDYYIRKTKKGLTAVGYVNDYPLQHGGGREWILSDVDYIKIIFGSKTDF